MAIDTGERVHVERRGVVPMALPFEEAFALFNAVGERRWVAGWDPHFAHPVEPRAGEGVVFQATGTGAESASASGNPSACGWGRADPARAPSLEDGLRPEGERGRLRADFNTRGRERGTAR